MQNNGNIKKGPTGAIPRFTYSPSGKKYASHITSQTSKSKSNAIRYIIIAFRLRFVLKIKNTKIKNTAQQTEPNKIISEPVTCCIDFTIVIITYTPFNIYFIFCICRYGRSAIPEVGESLVRNKSAAAIP